MPDTIPREALLKLPEVLRFTGLSESEAYRQMSAGVFPRPRKIASRSVAWEWGEVQDWIRTRPRAEGIRAA